MDVNKDGLLSDADIVLLAKNLAGYSKQGPETEKRYYETIKAVFGDGIGDGANEQQFIERMKKFVSRPDARERCKRYGAMVFEAMDIDKNGVVTRDEYAKFHRAAAHMNDELIEEMFNQVDVDKDGVIRRQEEEAIVIGFVLSS